MSLGNVVIPLFRPSCTVPKDGRTNEIEYTQCIYACVCACLNILCSLYFIDSVRLVQVEFHYGYFDVSVNLYFDNLIENPFLSYGDYYYETVDNMSEVPCFMNQLVFKNANTNETFQAEYSGRCQTFSRDFIQIRMNPRDYLRMITDEFINATSTTRVPMEMYTVDTLAAPLDIQIQSNDTFSCNFFRNTYSYISINEIDYWIDDRIILIHFGAIMDVSSVDLSLELSLSSVRQSQDGNNTVVLSGVEVLNESPGLAQSVAIRISTSDRALLVSKGICVRDFDAESRIQDCYLNLEEGFLTSHFEGELGSFVYPIYNYRTTQGEQ